MNLLRLVLCCGLVGPVAVASAQSPTPPDVVRLHDGTFLRATIVERSPTQLVVMLPTGETRTYSVDQVAFAGPDDAPRDAAAEESPAPPVAPEIAHLRVFSDQQDLSLQRLVGSTTVTVATTDGGVGSARVDQFSVICNAPCDVDIPRGTYQLGVAQGTGGAVRAGSPMDLREDTALRLRYDDRTGLRVAGWLSFGVGMGTGAALLLASVFAGSNYDLDVPMAVTGGVIAGLGLIAWAVLAFMFDVAEVERIGADGVRF